MGDNGILATSQTRNTTTMTDQLKLTLASGVVHGFKCRMKSTGTIFKIVGYDDEDGFVTLKGLDNKLGSIVHYSNIELLMHPTSKLTEPILPDGKIPIVELAKMAFLDREFQITSDGLCIANDKDVCISFLFSNNSFKALCSFEGTLSNVMIDNQLALFDQLDAWHINYRGVEAVEIIND